MGIHKIGLGKELSIVNLDKNCIALGLCFFDGMEVTKPHLLLVPLEMNLVAIAFRAPRNPIHLFFMSRSIQHIARA
jgi:hypothetical protein